MVRRYWVIVSLVMAGMLGGLAGCPPRQDVATVSGEAICRARAWAYLQKERPEWAKEVKTSHAVVFDRGDVWEVTWELPAGMLGGVPVVEVEKATLQVRRGYHTQ